MIEPRILGLRLADVFPDHRFVSNTCAIRSSAKMAVRKVDGNKGVGDVEN
jgi:hypothetical protein